MTAIPTLEKIIPGSRDGTVIIAGFLAQRRQHERTVGRRWGAGRGPLPRQAQAPLLSR
jgi:hypothetical protein